MRDDLSQRNFKLAFTGEKPIQTSDVDDKPQNNAGTGGVIALRSRPYASTLFANRFSLRADPADCRPVLGVLSTCPERRQQGQADRSQAPQRQRRGLRG